MKTVNKKLATAAIIALALPSATLAEGFYGSAQAGYSSQAEDSAPYGNNIAVDNDFPGAFDNDGSAVGAIGLGYRFNDNLRLEGRLGYRSSDFNDTHYGTGARNGEEYTLNGDISSTTFTIEGFYDFPNSTAFTPYVKAGIGVSRNKYSAKLGGAGVAAFDAFDGTTDGYYDNYADGKSTEFSWNVGFGGSYEMSKTTTLFAEYQYAQFGNVQTGQDSFTDGFKVDDAAAHEVMMGLRINF